MKILGALCLTALILLVGCTPSDRSLDRAQKRIDALKVKGVPDSSLSQSKVFLYGVRDAKRLGNNSSAWADADSLRHELAKAEALYNDHIAKLKPSVDSLVSIAQAAEQGFAGMQKKKVEDAKAVIDSFLRINWYLQAYTKAAELVNRLPQLKFDEERSKELRERIPGEWVCTNLTKGQENKAINATENKVFTFQKDGTANLVESKKGQSGNFLKEDYEFRSNGTYDFKGDTICLFIKRFAAVRQMFERYTVEGNKKYWKKEPGPTYDSTITDGSQDRFITFSDLKEDFKQQKKF